MFFWSAIFVLINAGGPDIHGPEAPGMNARLIDGHLVIVEKYTSPKTGKTYSILKIVQRENAKRMVRIPRQSNGEPSQEDFKFFLQKNFVPYITDGIAYKVATEYRNRNRQEALKALAEERPFFNGVSTIVVITDENNLSQIHAVGRLVRKGAGKNRLLDVESRNQFELPSLPIYTPLGYPHAFGNWGELKSLVQSKIHEEEFVPILWAALGRHATHSAAFSRHFWKWSSDTPQDPRDQVKDPLNGEIGDPFIDHFVLETDRAGERKYSKWGFKTLRVNGPVHVMTIDLMGLEYLMRSMDREQSVTGSIQPEEEWIPWPQLPTEFYLAFEHFRGLMEDLEPLAKAAGLDPKVDLKLDGIPINCLNLLARGGARPYIFRRHADRNIRTWESRPPRSPW